MVTIVHVDSDTAARSVEKITLYNPVPAIKVERGEKLEIPLSETRLDQEVGYLGSAPSEFNPK